MADEGTPFSEAVEVKPLPGTPNIFSASIPDDWKGAPSAHGGFLQSLVFSATRKYFETQHPSRNQPDPISSHLQFLKPVAIGDVTLIVKPVNIGSKISIVQVEIRTAEGEASNTKLCLLATVTQSNLATESGVTLPTLPALKAVPDRENDCEDHFLSESIRPVAPGAFKLIGRVPITENREASKANLSVREIWHSFADGTDFDLLSLGYLTDMFPGAPNEYVTETDIDYMNGIIYPTLSMTTEIKRDPIGCKWLFLRIQSYEIRNGRFDTSVTVLNEAGELIALSKHVSLALARKTEEELKRIYKL